MCAASHSCHAFRNADHKTDHAEMSKRRLCIDFFQSGWEGPDERPRAMCAASYSCHAFRIVDDKEGHVEMKNGNFVLIFYSPDGTPRMEPLSAGIGRRWGYIIIRNKDKPEKGFYSGQIDKIPANWVLFRPRRTNPSPA